MLKIFIPFAFRVKRLIQNIFSGYNWSSQTKLTDPTGPTNSGLGLDWSNDDGILAISHTGTPFLTTYTRSGDTFTKNTGNITASTINGGAKVAWSPDNSFLAVVGGSSPFIAIYQRTGDTTSFTLLSNPSTLPTGSAVAVAWNPTGKLLAVGHLNSPFITIYSRLGNAFTKLANPADLPDAQPQDAVFSPDGTKLALTVATATAFKLFMYSVSGNTFTKITMPSADFGTPARLAWSPQGDMLVMATFGAPYIFAFTVVGNTVTYVPNAFDIAPETTGRSPHFSPDGEYLALSLGSALGSGTMLIYRRTGNTFVKQTVTNNITQQALGLRFSNTGKYLAVGHSTNAPFMRIWKADFVGGTAPTLLRIPKTGSFYSRQPPYYNSEVVGFSGLPWYWNGVDLGYEGEGPVTVGEWTYYKGEFFEEHLDASWYGIYRTKAI